MKQIAGLFNDCIETIRNENYDNLEQMAIDWLKDARYQLMRKIEAEYETLILSTPNCGAHSFLFIGRYYKLAASRKNPTQQRSWALNSHEHLSVLTISHPPILRPYATAIRNNIKALMDGCGFHSTVSTLGFSDHGDSYAVHIHFPDRLTDARNKRIPRTLLVKDAIDTTVASNFARLIEGGDENGNPS